MGCVFTSEMCELCVQSVMYKLRANEMNELRVRLLKTVGCVFTIKSSDCVFNFQKWAACSEVQKVELRVQLSTSVCCVFTIKKWVACSEV